MKKPFFSMPWCRSSEYPQGDLEDVSLMLPTTRHTSLVSTLAWTELLAAVRPLLSVSFCGRPCIVAVANFDFSSTLCAMFLKCGFCLRTSTAPQTGGSTRRWRSNALSLQAKAASGSSFGRRSRKWRRNIFCPLGPLQGVMSSHAKRLFEICFVDVTWFHWLCLVVSNPKGEHVGLGEKVSKKHPIIFFHETRGMPRIHAIFGNTFTDWAFVGHSHAEQPQRWWLSSLR